MGVDIYAGPLCRYYAEDWGDERFLIDETVWSQDAGDPAKTAVSTIEGPFRYSLPRETNGGARSVQQIVAVGLEAAEWTEGYDLPYLTDKPERDGLDALRLVAAYSALGHSPRPSSLPLNVDDDPVIARFFNYENDNLLKNIELTIEFQAWVPVNFRGAMVRPEMPNGLPSFIGSVDILCEALDQINGRVWKASAEEVLRWRARGALSKGIFDPTVKQLTMTPTQPEGGLTAVEHMAQFGFSILLSLAHWANERRMPMVVDG